MKKTPINTQEGFALLKNEFKNLILQHDGFVSEDDMLFRFPFDNDLRTEIFVKLSSLRIFYEFQGFDIHLVPGKCEFYIEEC